MSNSTTIDADGDALIDLQERRFTLRETAFLAFVPDKSVRNWMARGLLNIGKKSRINGRWHFSIEDAVRLSIMHDLCVRPGLEFGPTKSALIADMVVKAGRDSTAPGANRNGFRPNINVLIAWSETGEMTAHAADIKEAGKYYPPARNSDNDYHPLRRTVVAIPATSLLIDTILRTEQLATINRRREAPVHV